MYVLSSGAFSVDGVLIGYFREKGEEFLWLIMDVRIHGLVSLTGRWVIDNRSLIHYGWTR
jgi:hypothetical protein